MKALYYLIIGLFALGVGITIGIHTSTPLKEEMATSQETLAKVRDQRDEAMEQTTKALAASRQWKDNSDQFEKAAASATATANSCLSSLKSVVSQVKAVSQHSEGANSPNIVAPNGSTVTR